MTDPTPRILLVEDNPVNLQVAAVMLEDIGVRVDTAENGWEALDRLAAEDYDLVFMDCQMPGLDGYETTERLRREEASGERVRRTPVIAITAHAFDDDRARCLAAGMDDYLSKPFTRRQIRDILCHWLPGGKDDSSVSGGGGVSSPPPDTNTFSEAPAEEVLDLEKLAGIRHLRTGSSEPLLPRIIGLYLADASGLVETIVAAARNGDIAAAEAAHALKSSSATVGAARLSRMCREMEVTARQGEADRIRRQTAKIEAEYGRVRQALEREGGTCI